MTRKNRLPICALLTSKPDLYEDFRRFLKDSYEILWVRDATHLEEELKQDAVSIIICDPNLGHIDIEQLVRSCQLLHPRAPLLFISEKNNETFAKWSFQRGVTNLIESPVGKEDVLFKIDLAQKIKEKAQDGGLSDQEIGHMYNLLKAYYYNLEPILDYIRNAGLTMTAVQGELEKKKRFGSCVFDHIQVNSKKVS